MIKILMVCYGGGHSKIIEKVYRKIKDELESEIEIEILALTSAFREFKIKGIPCKSLLDYNFKIKNKSKMKKYIPEYEKGFSISEEEHKLYNLLGIVDLFERIPNFDEVIKKFGRSCYLPLSAAKEIIKVENPDLIITTSSPRLEKAMLIVGKEKKIPTIQIEDLFSTIRESEEKLFQITKCEEYINYYGKYIFTLNEISKKNILKRGIKEDQIRITGNPNFETEKKEIQKEIQNLIQLKFKKRVLFLSQQTKNFEVILKEIQRISKEKKEILFLIKLHPNQNINVIETNNFKVYNENLVDLIKISNLVITEFSTAGLESLLLKKRLLVIQLSEENKDVIPFNTFDNLKIVKDILDLESDIDLEIEKKYVKTEKSFFQVDNSIETIFLEIKKILLKENLL